MEIIEEIEGAGGEGKPVYEAGAGDEGKPVYEANKKEKPIGGCMSNEAI